MGSERAYLVTGAAGFIGSHLVEALLSAGRQVIGIDSFDPHYDPKLKRGNIASLLAHEGFTLVEGDVRDPLLVRTCLNKQKIGVVVHLAARHGGQTFLEDPGACVGDNVAGTVNLLHECVGRGIERFILGSCSSVYGAANSAPFSEEQSISTPTSPYAASKIASEAFCYTYHHLYGLPVVCLRLFSVYGPRQRPDLLISKFVHLMLQDKPLPVYGDGEVSRGFTYVDDVVRGIIAASEHPKLGAPSSFEVINLGSDAPYTVMNIVRALELLLGIQARIDWRPPTREDLPKAWANVTKARKLLNWTPGTSLASGLRAFVRWCREQNCTRASA
ncbi:MAG: NAD-dependent epimerase/dehydratase family protein [Armatimonadetes bacterium]|nr:NAD-dependent epimerase/dehydratase family protein [Armatimonadota bacterium]